LNPKTSPPKQNNYLIAENLALDALRAVNLDELCAKNGASFCEPTLEIPYFNQPVKLNYPELTFDDELPVFERILVLHYLLGQEGKTDSAELVPFKLLPGALAYDPAYQNRGPKRLARLFGANPDKLIHAAKLLGGFAASLGDVSLTVPVFPKVPVTIVLYLADEEFSASAKIFYRRDITNYLSVEDVAVLAGIVVSKLKNVMD